MVTKETDIEAAERLAFQRRCEEMRGHTWRTHKARCKAKGVDVHLAAWKRTPWHPPT
jgi:hypothetical protein